MIKNIRGIDRVVIEGRYDRYAGESDIRQAFGVKRWPAEGMPECTIDGLQVYVRPYAPRANGRKSSTHRAIAICPCGQHVPCGRLHQHVCMVPNGR